VSESFAAGLVGVTLDERYRLDALLGEGGMGAVYRAYHLAMDRKVAVKLLKPHLTSDDAALQRFLREARSTMKVDSEHAVKVLDFGITPHRDYYMVLEYLDGRTVQQELDIDGPFSPARTVHIAMQVLHALAAAHGRGLVHRDIKPDNILLMRSGDDADFAKVLDFGVAKLMEGSARSAASMLSITQAGMVFGTPEFMSSEQACGQTLDGRSDLYSLAGTMFAMLTGCGLFRASAPIEWLMHHAKSPPPHLADALPSLARFTALDEALQTCLAKRREARPPTAEAMLELLASIAPTLDGSKPEGTAAASRVARTAFSPSAFVAAIDSAPPTPAPTPTTPTTTPTTNTTTTTTGDIRELSRARRGVWLALGAAAVLGLVVTTIIVAARGRSRGSQRVAVVSKEIENAGGPDAGGGIDAGAVVIDADAVVIDGGLAADAGVPRTPTHARIDPAVARHLAAAEDARRSGSALRQLAEADAALRADPRNAWARFLMADALITSGDLDRGCKYLRDLGKVRTALDRARKAGCPTN
jgi:eukaryotic-like serine/threonine-protein kinase